MTVRTEDRKISRRIVHFLKVAVVNDKNPRVCVIPAVFTFGNEAATFHPLSVSIDTWFCLSHQKTTTNLITNRIIVDGAGWRTLKGLPTDNTSQLDTTLSSQGFVVAVPRTVSSCLGAEVYYTKCLAAYLARAFHTIIGSMKGPHAFARAVLKRQPAVSRNVNCFTALDTRNHFEGGVYAST